MYTMSYVCNYRGCIYNTAMKRYFNKHVLKHTNPDSFRCLVSGCNYTTYHSDNMRQHKARKHPSTNGPSYTKLDFERSKPYICPERDCYIEFETSKTLRDHIYTHNDKCTDIEVLSESEEFYRAIVLDDF